MVAITESAFLWGAICAQFVGLASVAWTRLNPRSPLQALAQPFFFVCLLLVGLVTLVALGLGSFYWPFYGTTLALMAIGATVDCRRPRPVPTPW